MSLTVIKLGGSLMDCDELPAWLDAIQSLAMQTNVVIVPGGGKFADKVRESQSLYQFDDHAAHNMALLAMCQYAYLLVDRARELAIIQHAEVALLEQNSALPYLWLPTALLENSEEIPASWDYTSDSIALWLATKLAADRLFLVKSKTIDHTLSIEKHIENNDLDAGFKQFLPTYQGEIRFLEKSQYPLLNDHFL